MTRASLSTPANASAIMIANLILMGPNDLRPAMESMDRPVLFVFSDQEWATEAAHARRVQRSAGRASRGVEMTPRDLVRRQSSGCRVRRPGKRV
jgi:hypothetical protein